MAVTKKQLQTALKNWEIAREKVMLLRDNLKAFLKEQRKAIDAWQLRLDADEVKVDGHAYQKTKAMPGNTVTFDHQAFQAAIEKMNVCRAKYVELEQKFSFEQSKQPA